jgi:hypothetical protein
MKKWVASLCLVIIICGMLWVRANAPAQSAQPSVLVEIGCGGPAPASGSATFSITLDGATGPTQVTLACDDANRAVNQTYSLDGPVTGWSVDLSVSSDSGQNACSSNGTSLPVQLHCAVENDDHTIEFSMK